MTPLLFPDVLPLPVLLPALLKEPVLVVVLVLAPSSSKWLILLNNADSLVSEKPSPFTVPSPYVLVLVLVLLPRTPGV